jgi:hypothetical protein
MDHTEKLEMTEAETSYTNVKPMVLLAPDDILTLKLLRDWYAGERLRYPDEKHRPLHTEITLETLERIFKQVG